MLDDIGRRCIDRNTARALFTESAEQQARERAQRAEHKVHMAEQGAPLPGLTFSDAPL